MNNNLKEKRMNCKSIMMAASLGAALLMATVAAQAVDEGNGLYTCFFSAYDKTGHFQSIGKATLRVKEIVE
jgi:hypothetical protein